MWTDGYIKNIDYTYGYYTELSPMRLYIAALFQGFDVSLPNNFHYLELGYGQGISLNIHSASNSGAFWGTDFNPSHAVNAQSLSTVSNSNLTALDDSFEELTIRHDLPQFDIIALHGVWSWVSNKNRMTIINIAKSYLKPGGLFYISYNVTPGWSAHTPLRHLLVEYAEKQGRGQTLERIDSSINFLQSIIDADPLYFKANPGAAEKFKIIKNQNRQYIAHEYFNKDWSPMPFSTTASLLEDAKLTFATSAHILDQVDAINFTNEAQNVLRKITDPILRQTVIDYFVNQQFRRDIYIKGPRMLSTLEHARRLQAQAFMLLVSPEDRPEKVRGALGEAGLQESTYKPIVQALSKENMSPKTIGAIQSLCDGMALPRLLQALQILTATGTVAPVQNQLLSQVVLKTTKALNTELCRRAES